jgi:SAM-dependent methyltransferase
MAFYSFKGFCPCCESVTTFRARNHFYRRSLKCDHCQSVPRERALAYIVTGEWPSWRSLSIHECAPAMRGFSVRLKDECRNYTPTHFFPSGELGSTVKGYRNENIEAQTFPDNSFDIVISLDVMEHLFEPQRAYSEIWRTLRPGGAYVHTFPIHKRQVDAVVTRAVLNEDGSINHLAKKPKYHGNPFDKAGSLVTKDYGYDIAKMIAKWACFDVEVTRFWNETLGIIGEYTEVILCRKRDAR